MAGLFFCLASAEGAGLLFCPATIQPHTSVYNAFFAIYANYTASTQKAFTVRYRGVSVDLPYSSAHNTAATQAAYKPSPPRRRAYHQAQHPTDTRYHRHAGRYAGQHSRPVIIRYIRVQHIADHASPAGVSSHRLRIAGKCCTRRIF